MSEISEFLSCILSRGCNGFIGADCKPVAIVSVAVPHGAGANNSEISILGVSPIGDGLYVQQVIFV